MASLTGFNANNVPEQIDFAALPVAQYVLIAVGSEMKPTNQGNGEYLNITFEVIDGPYKGRKVWSRLNLINANETAVQIAQRELGALCRAVGVITPDDSSELHNKPFLATVEIELDEKKRERNTITKYEALNGAVAPVAGVPAAAPIQHQASPFGQSAPAAQASPFGAQTTAAAGSIPPWKQ